ncbi:AfsR/SARP family transcriptional regulator [Actinoplanes aureus]|uniref:Winged helix-turn-helix domain-containing protein n=1 Tax=Actinoplanes aureus TaxID=2792083 RepID=A0A931CH36_9ACTN|nr:BTAD domain-containing putative transcriptional regulator [Actinoplanes aureus]MBG0566351.1 winged helix-turn-helix domain-containing protein [Actinoplanes aureus]
MDLTFGVLGPLEIRAGGELITVKAPKQRALVASLVLRAGRNSSLAELYAALWGDEQPADPKAAVHNYVRRLRRLLGEDAIETTSSGYRLAIDPQQVDLHRFRALVAEARLHRRAEDPAAESETLRQALALWRGAPLADVHSDYLQRYELSGLTEERLAAVERRIDADLRNGAHTQVISELRKLTGEYPLHEGFWSQLIVALYRDGRNADALATYHHARGVLAEETGIDPGDELQQLYQRVLDRDPTLAVPTSTESVPPPPPVAAPSRVVAPSQLPSDVADFVGRRHLVSGMTELLVPDREAASPPIVVLSGMPAVGKTALAVHVAHEVREHFPDGQLFADLRGFGIGPAMKPGELLPRFLRGLGAATDTIPLDLDEQVMLYRSLLVDKRVLIVLDNARNPEQVRPLLPATSRCAVLITSRSQLQGLIAMQGGRPFTLEPLSEHAAEELVGRLIGADRVAAEPGAVRRLAQLCGNLPLALRIAGAMLASRAYEPIADYVSELEGDDRLSVFSLDDDQQSAVRATFEHSYRALSTEQQRWFRLLSLIPGPTFTAPVAAALLDAPGQAAAMLASLVAANLVEAGDARYRVHDLLRAYAAQLCESEEPETEQESAARRVLDYYAHATTAASHVIEPHRPSPTLPPSTTVVPPPQFVDRAQAITWLDDERDNLHAAVAYAANSGPLASAWQLGDAMTSPLALTERYTEWIAVTRLGLKAAIRAADEQGEAIMRLSLGHAYITAGRQQLGIDHLRRAATLYQQMGDRQYQVVCENALGMAALWLGQLDVAVRSFERIRELNTSPSSPFYEVGAAHGLGIAYRYQGDLARSAQMLTAAAETDTQVGPEYSSAGIHLELACTHREQGRSSEALKELVSTIAQFRRIGSRLGECRTAVVIAGTHLDLGNAELAQRFAEEALELARMINHRRTEAEALNALGASLLARGDASDARRCFTQARSLAAEMGYLNGEIEALQQLAAAERELGVLSAARKCVTEALTRIERSGFGLHRGTVLLRRAAIELDEGTAEAAERTCVEAITVFDRVGQALGRTAAEALRNRIHDGDWVRRAGHGL